MFELTPGRFVGSDQPVFIIAEIGQNHQGDLNLAKEMIAKAKEAGADCVKFQKSNLEAKFTKDALKAPYSGPNSWGPTYGEHKAHLEFSLEQYQELVEYSRKLGIPMTASAMDCESLDFLVSLDVPFIKIGSGDSNNPLILEKASQLDKPLVVSTGMSDMEQVKKMVNILQGEAETKSNIVLMQCTSSYPTPPQDVNLKILDLYQESLSLVIGYSGHEMASVPTLGAVARGAKVIERHVTLDKNMKGTDHKCSLDMEEFKALVESIRIMESALGVKEKKFLPSEQHCFDKLGKTLVAAKDLTKGQLLTKDCVAVKVHT